MIPNKEKYSGTLLEGIHCDKVFLDKREKRRKGWIPTQETKEVLEIINRSIVKI